ncbi:glycosyltransferase [Marinobacter salicampi]|uniref:glycosyltransferase n=1 Tax=Marinobacter salicampi TaxID=435907 RepID=UPI00140D3B84|nr:glycosyltransferase [Marinobacter salicampi]
MASSDTRVEQAWTLLVPGDPGQRTGGYAYVREVASSLRSLGQAIELKGLPGRFPEGDEEAVQAMEQALAALPDGAIVVLDGLAMGGLPAPLENHSSRLSMIALVHHALADESGLDAASREHYFRTERRALGCVQGVITTSAHTAEGLGRFGVTAPVCVVEPGVAYAGTEPPEPAPAKPEVVRILCVATLSARKAQHQLVAALGQLRGQSWHCTLAGSTTRQADYAEALRSQIEKLGLSHQFTLTGELGEADMQQVWQQADLFVLPSLHEGYGMVIDEALAHGLPIIASDGGALAQTARRPGILQYQAGDIAQLQSALEKVLASPHTLSQLQQQALESRATLRSWITAGQEFRSAVRACAEAGTAAALNESTRSQADPSRFEDSWLQLREPADHRSRDHKLTAAAAQWLRQKEPHEPLVLDLGCGSGSNYRYFYSASAGAYSARTGNGTPLAPDARWLLVDQDQTLLAVARRLNEEGDCYAESRQIRYQVCRLTSSDFPRQLPDRPDLITASALIDLVTAPWLQALARYANSARAGLLVTLSYAGDFSFSPAHPDDSWLLELVNRHQQSDKGEGKALGPHAPRRLQQELEAEGYHVQLGDSPWHLDKQDQALQAALVDGWKTAALDQSPDDARRITLWAEARQKAIAAGQLGITVSHVDLFATPGA